MKFLKKLITIACTTLPTILSPTIYIQNNSKEFIHVRVKCERSSNWPDNSWTGDLSSANRDHWVHMGPDKTKIGSITCWCFSAQDEGSLGRVCTRPAHADIQFGRYGGPFSGATNYIGPTLHINRLDDSNPTYVANDDGSVTLNGIKVGYWR